ncbi:hypothetical protein [Desulfurobacterium indicum]|uniref:V-type proton ATPase subunit E n=1 Tax=Desulfurobacterium indicum TaxID=1914305 RepID=A0A1R1MLT3_9BACT|nr:hypothetical protein [Desulfurobacterium indicum]OMH40747.1 hypothetical protein BLW93_03475 [Desulfurobacterium indicum]
MFSESDFSKFKDKVLERAKEIARDRVNSAKAFAQEKLIEAEREGRRLYQEKLKAAQIELESFKFNAMAEIDAKIRKAVEDKEVHVREELVKELRKRLKERFPMMLECFIVWIKNNFNDGTIIVSPSFKEQVKKAVGNKYTITESTDINGVIFKHDRMVIEFSLDSILEEFKGEIDREIASILEG